MLHELHEFDVGDVYVLIYLKPVSDKLCTGDRLFIINHLLNSALDDLSLLSLLFLSLIHI